MSSYRSERRRHPADRFHVSRGWPGRCAPIRSRRRHRVPRRCWNAPPQGPGGPRPDQPPDRSRPLNPPVAGAQRRAGRMANWGGLRRGPRRFLGERLPRRRDAPRGAGIWRTPDRRAMLLDAQLSDRTPGQFGGRDRPETTTRGWPSPRGGADLGRPGGGRGRFGRGSAALTGGVAGRESSSFGSGGWRPAVPRLHRRGAGPQLITQAS